MVTTEPTTPLGRSLRFGRCAGALAVLHTNSIIDSETLRLSLPDSGLSPAHLKCMWSRLLAKHEDPRCKPARIRPAPASHSPPPPRIDRLAREIRIEEEGRQLH
ncbi:MAG: hypothetical protein QM777_06565 [Pseudorhodoferax sp.]